MANKGALAVNNLLDDDKLEGISTFLTDKEVIPESSKGYGGLSFTLEGTGNRFFKHTIFLNFRDLYDFTINGEYLEMTHLEVLQFLQWYVAYNLDRDGKNGYTLRK